MDYFVQYHIQIDLKSSHQIMASAEQGGSCVPYSSEKELQQLLQPE